MIKPLWNWPDGFQQPFANKTLLKNGWFSQEFGQGLVAFLTTENRLQLVKKAPSGDGPAVQNLLQALYRLPRSAQDAAANHIAASFKGQRIALDITALTRMQLRVADSFVGVPDYPSEARIPMSTKRRLDVQGDGIRSFAGMVVALTVLNRPLVLIDEPEAFLGPPQAHAIGRFIASMADAERQIVVATHSTDVLRGLLSETQDVKIMRIDRIDDTNSFCELTSETLEEISENPLMNSARVLDALFYETTIVGEGDRDCRFYEAAMQKLVPKKQYHFVNANSKQTVAKIMAVYDKTGVRRAGIVDFDMLRESREWRASLKQIGFTDVEIDKLTKWRGYIGEFAKEQPAEDRIKEMRPIVDEVMKRIKAFENATFEGDEKREAAETLSKELRNFLSEGRPAIDRWPQLKKRGRNELNAALKKTFDELSSLSAERGLFIVPTGALESTMEEHGVPYTRNKSAWLEKALSKIPTLAVDRNEQPWKFLNSPSKYLSQNAADTDED